MKFFAPEVVQTSAMDCGPAALKCLLEGFGVSASYGRLREACQTDVDGTSIDTLEDIAVQLGLDAEQIMVPKDHVLLDEADALPAIVVVRLPNGFTHFVVVWRRHGPWVQLMDPASGRRWWTREQLVERLYVHETSVPAEAFREWALSDDFAKPLARRMRDIGCEDDALVDQARAKDWSGLAALDAGTRMLGSLVASGAIAKGSDARAILAAILEDSSALPESWFTARPAPDVDGEPQVRMRGAVLLRVTGVSKLAEKRRDLPRDLARALDEPPTHPLRELARFVRESGWLTPSALLFAVTLAGLGALVEAVLLRAALDLPRDFATVEQRLGAVVALIVFLLGVRLLDGPIAASTVRIGRQIEVRLRRAFLEKIPRLEDRYFQSRPISDMAERAHAIAAVRTLPELGAGILRSCAELAATTFAIAWFDPPSAPFAIVIALGAVLVPLAWQPALLELDMRVRTHGGALARLTLDALLGLMPIRSHNAQTAIAREHESLLVEWTRSSRELVTASAWAGTIQYAVVVSAVAWMVVRFVARTEDTSGVLLLVYWGLALPTLSEEIALNLRQYPGQRNATMRLLEPLGALEEPTTDARADADSSGGVSIELRDVTVVAGGHTILSELSLEIRPGEQVAVIGPSGAGKSSLAGLLLGWHRAAAGDVLVDGSALDRAHLDRLRRCTAWVDPAIQVWNRSLLDNLQYGAEPSAADHLAAVLENADVQPLLDRLPSGLQTPLGEGGALVSGGEGQRVRLGRSMMRPNARLVVLDEPFRGLDRDRRRALLARAKNWWKQATLLCITHDVSETLDFDRVLVVEGGKIVEDAAPRTLADDPSSRYRALLLAERALLESLWGGPEWRRARLVGGQLTMRGER